MSLTIGYAQVIIFALLLISGGAIVIEYAIRQTRRRMPLSWQEMETRYDRQAARQEADRLRMDKMQEEIDELREERAIDFEEMRELRDGIGRLVEQIRRANLSPVWTPDQVKRRLRADQAEMVKRIERQFNVEEIDALAFELGVVADEIKGETRGERARSLVQWSARHGLFIELTRRVDEERPQHA